MPKLWQKMTALYGRQWEASYGQPGGAVYKEWSKGLAKLKPDQIARGLKSVMDEGGEYPPNLIKFLRLCRQVQPAYHKPVPQALPRPKPHYSVMRIEKAKQAALTGQDFEAVKPPEKMEMDWTGEDEERLYTQIGSWNPASGHAGLNALIDHVEFSGGKHHDKCKIGELHVDKYDHLGQGTIHYVEKSTPFHAVPYLVNGIAYPGDPWLDNT